MGVFPGQRFMSMAEPDLGLGRILRIEGKILSIEYPAIEEIRQYGLASAPLKRIRFEIGDEVISIHGHGFIVEEVIEQENGLLMYKGKRPLETLCESELAHTMNFHRPEEKLLSVLSDKQSLFQLRNKAFEYQSKLAALSTQGFLGGRLSLIEHQFYLANKVSARTNPRVLLADEVGLGKTIETGLILHKLVITGRVERVLIVTPSSLNYQWFIEMLRKFNLSFSVVNEQTHLEAKENPFDQNNFVITSMELLSGSEVAMDMAMGAHWDLLIVDEAHKLYWKKTGPSVQYTLISKLAQLIKGLILLTATPEIYGQEGHFSHLKLIDPDKYPDFDLYLKQSEEYQEIAKQGKEIIEKEHTKKNRELLDQLIDQHGPGRVIFRNTRKAINEVYSFFPKRILVKHCLENNDFINFAVEKRGDRFYQLKIQWLVDLLEQDKKRKYLLICHSKDKIVQIEKDILKKSVGNKVGLFHENLSLMARDRQAAYFREDDGPNILLCSEIGSEGRNFQFCQHLILFDIPRSADLLEQRIGRLDRIGQNREIFIHLPYLENSWEQVQIHWYEQVFDAFARPAIGANKISEDFDEDLTYAKQNVQDAFEKGGLDRLIKNGGQAYQEYIDKLENGRNVLIELNSFNREMAKEVTREIRRIDDDHDDLKVFLEQVYTHFGIDVEDLNEHSQFIRPSVNMFVPSFPGLTEQGLSYTFDRSVALEREDLAFMTWDHPLVIGAMDLITSEEYGNSTIAVRKNGKINHFLEVYFKFDTIAPKKYQLGRFLKVSLIRVLINTAGEDYSEKWDKEALDERLEDAPKAVALEVAKIPKHKMKQYLHKSKEYALIKMTEILKQSKREVLDFYGLEINRLMELQKINKSINVKEIEQLEVHKDKTIEYIDSTMIKLDSIRFIF
jgi:ATP-dependent helicase HepA